MKLYSEDSSPFCAPVRLAIYAKGLDIPIEPPPGGLRTEAYRQVSMTGNIPCLMLDDGTPLPESTVIIDYLEDKFPDRPLKPAGAEPRAREALIRRIAETDLSLASVNFFYSLQAGGGDAAAPVAAEKFERGLTLIETLMSDDGYVAGPHLTTADCILAPALLGVAAFAPLVGRPTLMADHPKVAAYAARAARHPAVAKVTGELQVALAASGITLG
ncbi:glutathione S-transferase family protein [Phenylobacterium sp.]|uniref:glutathione S-transferase family protein n=1 Tax=Phenylobacterium sp. TaxID=1871053 RepID=UPI0025DA5A35|nr:glutathione S-transferase family protein [Phenylobacterium sp.]